jgi:hypothetical protein
MDLLTPRQQELIENNKYHHDMRIRNAKPAIDMRPPLAVSLKSRKKTAITDDMNRQINSDNFKLASNICRIFQSEARIQNELRTPTYLEEHPGTMNFHSRLNEAKRINKNNVQIAKRLDSIKSYYNKANFEQILRKPKRNTRKTPNAGIQSQHSNNQAADSVLLNKEHDCSILLFEYSKIQDDRVLDIAVTKDSIDDDDYTIYGIDVDSGQKYELHISAGLLEENILVTGVNDPNIWMALLNGRPLLAVDEFTPVEKKSRALPRAPPESGRPSAVRPLRRSVIREAEDALHITTARIREAAVKEEVARLEEAAAVLRCNMDALVAKKSAGKNTVQRMREDRAAVILQQIMRLSVQRKSGDKATVAEEGFSAMVL